MIHSLRLVSLLQLLLTCGATAADTADVASVQRRRLPRPLPDESIDCINSSHANAKHATSPSAAKQGVVPLRVAIPDTFSPVADVTFGNKSYKMIIAPDSVFTTLQADSEYRGKDKTSFIHTFVSASGDHRADQIYLEDVEISNVTARQTAVGLANVNFLSQFNAHINDSTIRAEGFLGFSPVNARGYDTEDPSLLGFSDVLGQTMTLSYGHGWNSDSGNITFGQGADFWVPNIAQDARGYSVALKINGVAISEASIYSTAFLSRAPEGVVHKIFEASGLRPEYEDEGGAQSVVAQVDCKKGHPMRLDFDDGGSIEVPGLSNMWKNDDRNGTCWSALRSSLDSQAWLGYPLFRAAAVTFDAAGDGRIGLTQAEGHVPDEDPPLDSGSEPHRVLQRAIF